jgi:hypothetical protein
MQLEIIQSIACGMHKSQLMILLIKLHHDTYVEKKKICNDSETRNIRISNENIASIINKLSYSISLSRRECERALILSKL